MVFILADDGYFTLGVVHTLRQAGKSADGFYVRFHPVAAALE